MTLNEFDIKEQSEREDWFLQAYDNHTSDFKEIWNEIYPEVCYGDWFETVECIPGDNRRWYKWITVIFRVKDRYFRIGYDQGLTEMQSDMTDDSSIEEVYPHQTVITQTITEWISKEKTNG